MGTYINYNESDTINLSDKKTPYLFNANIDCLLFLLKCHPLPPTEVEIASHV